MRITNGELTIALSIALLGGVGLVGRARAQTEVPPEAVPVRERPHPEFDPLGIRLGAFLIHPEVKSDFFYNSNLLGSGREPVGAFASRLSPSVTVESNWSRHSLEINVAADRYQYFGHSGFDHWNGAVDTEGRIDIRHDIYANFSTSIARRHDLPGSVDSPVGATEPLPYNLYEGEFELYKDFNRFRVSLGASGERRDYQDVEGGGTTIDQDFRDRDVLVTGGRVAYLIRPGYYAFGDVRINQRIYDKPGVSAGNSAGTEALSGVEFELTSLIRGEVGIGYLWQNYADPAFSDVAGYSFNASMAWDPTTLMTLTLDGGRQVNDSPNVGLDGGRIDTSLRATLDYELLRNLILSPYFAFRHEDYNESDRVDVVYQPGFDVDYKLNRYFELSAGYQFTRRDSDIPDAGFNGHLVSVNATAHF